MLHALKRHPFPVEANFEHCLVLAYAFPAPALEPLLPPGLTLDTHRGFGFLAAAFVQTRALRPAFLPAACGQDFFLAGYRVFVGHRTPEGRTLRGLRILRSDADKRAMVWGGNFLTHYNYHLCSAEVFESGRTGGLPARDARENHTLTIRIRTPNREADADLTAHLNEPNTAEALPPGSPFADEREARRFAGPLPWTFDYEAPTNSIVRIKGVRQSWAPRLVRVDVRELSFLRRGHLAGHTPLFASAFHVARIPYRWERGILDPLGRKAA